MLSVSGIVNTVRSAIRTPAQRQRVDPAVSPASPEEATLAQTIARFEGQPGWALDRPEDPATFHIGNSEKAARFQHALSNIDQFAGWSTSHMCIWYTMLLLRSSPPRTYLEIGVNEGLSLLALVTAIQFQYLVTQTSPPAEILDELVLADLWGIQYGGTGKGSNEHIKRLVKSLSLDIGRIRFVDGQADDNPTHPFVAHQHITTAAQHAQRDMLLKATPYNGRQFFTGPWLSQKLGCSTYAQTSVRGQRFV